MAKAPQLAFQLQQPPAEALDLSQETEATKVSYGLNDPKGEHKPSDRPSPIRSAVFDRPASSRARCCFVEHYDGGGHQQNWDWHQGGKPASIARR